MSASNVQPSDDTAFWRRFYQDSDTPWDLAGPAPPFLHLIAERKLPLTKGALAVPGSGKGHDAALFGQNGFTVTGFDIAPEAMAAATNAYGSVARFELADFFAQNDLYRQQFDAVVEHTCFCAIPLARRADYVATVEAILKPGGWLIGLFWDHGRPGGPPYTVDEAEIRTRFSPGFDLVHLARTPHSTPARANQEWLGLFRRKSA